MKLMLDLVGNKACGPPLLCSFPLGASTIKIQELADMYFRELAFHHTLRREKKERTRELD